MTVFMEFHCTCFSQHVTFCDRFEGQWVCQQQLFCFKTYWHLDLFENSVETMWSQTDLQWGWCLTSLCLHCPRMPRLNGMLLHWKARSNISVSSKPCQLPSYCLKIKLSIEYRKLWSQVYRKIGYCPFKQQFQFLILEISSGKWNSVFLNFFF